MFKSKEPEQEPEEPDNKALIDAMLEEMNDESLY